MIWLVWSISKLLVNVIIIISLCVALSKRQRNLRNLIFYYFFCFLTRKTTANWSENGKKIVLFSSRLSRESLLHNWNDDFSAWVSSMTFFIGEHVCENNLIQRKSLYTFYRLCFSFNQGNSYFSSCNCDTRQTKIARPQRKVSHFLKLRESTFRE